MEEYNALLGEEVELDCSIVDLPFGPEGFSAADLLGIEDFVRIPDDESEEKPVADAKPELKVVK